MFEESVVASGTAIVTLILITLLCKHLTGFSNRNGSGLLNLLDINDSPLARFTGNSNLYTHLKCLSIRILIEIEKKEVLSVIYLRCYSHTTTEFRMQFDQW